MATIKTEVGKVENEKVKESKTNPTDEKQTQNDPYSFVDSFENAPSRSDLETWKELYGNIFVSPLSDTQLYVFRKITRIEWKNIIKEMRKAGEAGANIDEFWLEEKTVQKCLLFPAWTVELKNSSPAGTISTLHKQILSVSNFVDDETATRLIVQL